MRLSSWCRAVLCLLVAGCWWTGAEHAHAQVETLFEDTFTTDGTSNWVWGNNLSGTNTTNNQIFTTTDTEMSDQSIGALEMVDGTPINTPIDPEVHTKTPVSFSSATNSILQLNVDLIESTNNTSPGQKYIFGLSNSSDSTYLYSVSSFLVAMEPNKRTNNVVLQTYSAYGESALFTYFTVPKDWLQGAHRFSLQIDYSTSTNNPVVQAYADDNLLGSITSRAGGAEDAIGGFSDGTNVRIFVMGQSASTDQPTDVDITNVNLYAYPPGTSLIGQITGRTFRACCPNPTF